MDNQLFFYEVCADYISYLLSFDSNDLKFIAVYLGSKNKVVICNASDSDWGNDKSLLLKYDIKVYEILQEEC